MDSRRVTMTVLGAVIKLAVAAAVVMVVYKLAIFAYDFGYRVFAEPAMDVAPGKEVTVVIEEGYDAKKIGKLLEQKGLIRDAKLFFVQELLSEYKDKVQPGVYTLNTSMTAEEMLGVMAAEIEDTNGQDAGMDTISQDELPLETEEFSGTGESEEEDMTDFGTDEGAAE